MPKAAYKCTYRHNDNATNIKKFMKKMIIAKRLHLTSRLATFN